MGYPRLRHLAGQGGGDMALSDDVLEGLGPVLAIESLVHVRLA